MKKEKNLYVLIAGGINLFTAILHLIGGQIELINPLFASNLIPQAQVEILGAWHMVTLVLFATSYILLQKGLNTNSAFSVDLIKFIAYLYLLFSLPSLLISLWYMMFVPQWIILMPIGVLALLGIKKVTEVQKKRVHESA